LRHTNTEPNCDGVAHSYAGYPNADSDSYTDSDANGHGISDSNTGYANTNSHT
jgi:hypothetical protein